MFNNITKMAAGVMQQPHAVLEETAYSDYIATT